MISIDRVSFGYGEAQETLSQVSAAIAPGECVLLCGASGCGKTTVTKLINGLIPAFTPGCRLEGRVEVDGLDPGTTPMYELARKVGSVFQNPKSQFFNLDTDKRTGLWAGKTRVGRRMRSGEAGGGYRGCAAPPGTASAEHFLLIRRTEAAACFRLRLRHGAGDFCAGRTHGQSGPGRHRPAPRPDRRSEASGPNGGDRRAPAVLFSPT